MGVWIMAILHSLHTLETPINLGRFQPNISDVRRSNLHRTLDMHIRHQRISPRAGRTRGQENSTAQLLRCGAHASRGNDA